MVGHDGARFDEDDRTRGTTAPPALRQQETRPISQEQLVAEVKGIYAGLVMVENKCIEVDKAQSSQDESTDDPSSDQSLSSDQWQALIALHRTLLHEHHDFFLASQHPATSPALRRLAARYAMPARMWRHGIHSFLELLRHRLPASLDHMLTFIYFAYSMMALLHEQAPALENTRIECLEDLGRYRMAIEDDDIRDREVWTAVNRHSRASDKAPTTGRLYHHLAILARPNALQQLYYYNKSLCAEMPFLSARESIMTLFEPIMARDPKRRRMSVKDGDVGGWEIWLRDEARGRRLSQPSAMPVSIPAARAGEPLSVTFTTPSATNRPPPTSPKKSGLRTPRSHPSNNNNNNNNNNTFNPRQRSSKRLKHRHRDHPLIKPLSLLLPTLLSLLPLATATPDTITHRTPKILATSLSAFLSLGTGMTALQLPLPRHHTLPQNTTTTNPTQEEEEANSLQTQLLTKLALRLSCSLFLIVLTACYAVWFLRGRHARTKRQAFLVMFWVCTLVCWFLVRPASLASSPAAGAGNGDGGGDGLLWLDGVNLFGLVAVVGGVVNAEAGLFSSSGSLAEGGGGERGEGQGGFELGGAGGEEGREDGRRRRDGEVEDEESQAGSRGRGQTRGDGRRGDGEGAADGRETVTAAATGDVGLGYLSMANGLFA